MPDDRGSTHPAPPDGADELLEVLAEEAGAGRGGHPSDDELFGYRSGELDPSAGERVEEHLVGCRECTVRLLDLDALAPDPAAAEGEAADFELATAWRDLRSALPAEERGAGRGGGREPAWARWSDRVGGHRAVRVLAAVLAVAVVGLGLWVTQLRQDVRRLGAPQANLPVLYLDEPVRAAAAGAEPALTAPDAGHKVLLIVTPAGGPLLSEYRAVLRAEEGRELWRGTGLRPSGVGTLRVLLPGRLLRPGRYELRLGGPSADGSRDLARYRFRVLREARGPAP